MSLSSRTARRRLGLLAALTALAALFVVFTGAPAASAATSNGTCMVDRFNATKPAKENELNCTSNDVQLATLTRVSGATECVPGESVTVGLKGEFLSTANERYDVGVFIAQDGGTPNDPGGKCYSDFLHFASTNNTDLNLTGGSGPFYNAETGVAADTCGDIDQGSNAFLTMASVSLVCQDSNGDGQADVASCTVWGNSASGANDPKCTSEANVTAETTAKCTCVTLPILGLNIKASLKLVKTVTNDSGGGAAVTDFTLSAAGPTPISGPGGVEAKVDKGTYALSETGPAGYTAGSWSCVGGTQNGSSITLKSGESAVCTINNNDDPAHLKLVKVVKNDNGGTAVATNWTLKADGTVDYSGAGGFDLDVNAGTYALSESAGPAGYTAGSFDCGASVTLALGESKTCTITNDDRSAHLKLVKTVTNDNGGKAAATDWTLKADGTVDYTGAGGFDLDVDAGTYALSESAGPAGYVAGSFDCGASVTLALGETKTCTINNDDRPNFFDTLLTVVKVVQNNWGGTATVSSFTLKLGSTTVTSGVPNVVTTGVTYTVSEATPLPAGYEQVGITGDCAANGTITPQPLGGPYTCTITNRDIAPKIVVKKVSIPASTGSFTFTTTGTGYNGFTLAGGTQNSQTLSVGTYTVTETAQTGWLFTGLACVVTGNGGSSTVIADLKATITLKLGDTVTCTYENTKRAGTVTRTQGFWSTHTGLADVAWFGGNWVDFNLIPGVASTAGIGDTLLCGRDIDTLGKLMGGFWSNVAKKSTGAQRSDLDKARMTLLQQLLAAELNASAFGSVPAGGSGQFAVWEAAYCGTNITAINTAKSQAAAFNEGGDSGTFTPGTAADSKNARAIANYAWWDVLP